MQSSMVSLVFLMTSVMLFSVDALSPKVSRTLKGVISVVCMTSMTVMYMHWRFDESEHATEETNWYFYRVSPKSLVLTHLLDVMGFAAFNIFTYLLRCDFAVINFPLIRQDDLRAAAECHLLSFHYSLSEHRAKSLEKELHARQTDSGIPDKAWVEGLCIKDCNNHVLGGFSDCELEDEWFPLYVQWQRCERNLKSQWQR